MRYSTSLTNTMRTKLVFASVLNFLKLSLLLSASVITTFSMAQEKIFEYDPVGMAQNKSITSSFIIDNPTDNSKAIFIIESNSVHGLFCDENLNFRKNLVFKLKSKEYHSFLGYSINGNITHLVFVNSTGKELYTVSFDPQSDNVYGSQLPYKIPDTKSEEYFIAEIYHNQTLFLLYSIRNSSILKLYQVQSDKKVINHEFDLSAFNSSLNSLSYKNLFELFNFPDIFNSGVKNIASYNSDTFYDLDMTFYPIKVYSYQDHIIISFDSNNQSTTIVDINSEKNTAVLKNFALPNLKNQETQNKKSASYYYKNDLMQISYTNQSLAFSVRDILTDSIRAFYTFDKANTYIPFVNLPFILEGKGIKAHEFTSPEKSLKEISKVTPSLSAFQFGDTLEIKFGGYLYSSGNYIKPEVGPNGFFPAGLSFTKERFIYSIGLFDPVTYKHLEGKVIPNAFIEMDNLNYTRKDYISGETKHFSNNSYYYGFYHKTVHKYFLYKYQ